MVCNIKQPKRKILCVDDNIGVLRTMARIFRKTNVHPITTNDPECGLMLASTELPELILLDVRMPKIDGYEFMDRLRAEGHGDIPIVMVSAELDSWPAFALGCSGYLVKPCNSTEILRTVSYLLEEGVSKPVSSAGSRRDQCPNNHKTIKACTVSPDLNY